MCVTSGWAGLYIFYFHFIPLCHRATLTKVVHRRRRRLQQTEWKNGFTLNNPTPALAKCTPNDAARSLCRRGEYLLYLPTRLVLCGFCCLRPSLQSVGSQRETCQHRRTAAATSNLHMRYGIPEDVEPGTVLALDVARLSQHGIMTHYKHL